MVIRRSFAFPGGQTPTPGGLQSCSPGLCLQFDQLARPLRQSPTEEDSTLQHRRVGLGSSSTLNRTPFSSNYAPFGVRSAAGVGMGVTAKPPGSRVTRNRASKPSSNVGSVSRPRMVRIATSGTRARPLPRGISLETPSDIRHEPIPLHRHAVLARDGDQRRTIDRRRVRVVDDDGTPGRQRRLDEPKLPSLPIRGVRPQVLAHVLVRGREPRAVERRFARRREPDEDDEAHRSTGSAASKRTASAFPMRRTGGRSNGFTS
jgi:hypothetical protein